MKKTMLGVWTLATVLGFTGTSGIADTTKSTTEQPAVTTSADVNNTIEMVRTLYQADKKAIVAENLPLTDVESAAFWKVYNEFQVALQKVGDKKLEMVKRYAANYNTLTDQTASSLLDDSFKFEKEEIKVRESFRPRFLKVMPATKVARFYQIENKIGALTKVALAKEIPLAK